MASTNRGELRIDNIVERLYGDVFGIPDEARNHREVLLTHLTVKWMTEEETKNPAKSARGGKSRGPYLCSDAALASLRRRNGCAARISRISWLPPCTATAA